MIISNVKQINEYERGILFSFGKFSRIVGSGWTVILPIVQGMRKVDIRTKTVDLKSQECMSADNVSVSVGAVVFFKITDAAKVVLEVENYLWAVTQLAETTMRTVVGEVTLQELLTSREDMAKRIEDIIMPKAEMWGIHIEAVELKDIVLPEDMKRTMAKQAEAQREKISVITASEGELVASENLQKAAKVLSATPGALHLRTLATINDVSSDASNTIIFAVPIEVLRAFDGMSGRGGEKSAAMEAVVSAIEKKLTGK